MDNQPRMYVMAVNNYYNTTQFTTLAEFYTTVFLDILPPVIQITKMIENRIIINIL